MSDLFRVVVADPPWLFGDKLPGKLRGASQNYVCMPSADIGKLATRTHKNGVKLLHLMGQPIADDAILFLWRVAAIQQAGLDVATAWGFTVKTELVWLKKTVNGRRFFGMGRTLRAEHEICLVATRGRPELKNHSTRTTFVTDLDVEGLSAEVGRHSEKPSKFFDIIESLVDGPYLELFARRHRPGWTCIGDELTKEPA